MASRPVRQLCLLFSHHKQMAIGAAVGQHARDGIRAAVEQRDSLTLHWPNGVYAADGANFGLHLTSLRLFCGGGL